MTVIIMPNDYTTRYQLDMGNPLVVKFVHNDLSPYSLVGVDKTQMTRRVQNVTNKVAVNGTGTWSTIDDINGVAQYNWGAADVADVALKALQTTIPFASGPVTFKPIEINFVARL